MKEIEVKIKVADLDKCVAIFENQGCVFSAPKTQDDMAYFPKELTDNDLKVLGKNFLRIRRENDRILFTLKQPQTNQLDCLEYELEISDAEEMENIIRELGYVPYIGITKTRREGTLKDYSICIDNVDKLGSFIELEKMTDQDADTVQKEMMEFLGSIGIVGEQIHDGYDILMKRELGSNI